VNGMGTEGGMRIALLHTAPVPGDFAGNIARIREGIASAASKGAEWVLTPELSTSGYTFSEKFGLGWIGPPHDQLIGEVVRLSADLNVTLFLAAAERDVRTGLLYNSIQVFDGRRGWVGAHRKVNTLKIGSEAWSSSGAVATVLRVGDFGLVGLLICADACSLHLAKEIKRQGAKAIVSSANWSPGQWGPAGEWEAITKETCLPLFVCNRTGSDGSMSFSSSDSVVVAQGLRLLSVVSLTPRLILVDWDFSSQSLVNWSSEPLSQPAS
jgi:predicted amidohydrolase